MSKIAERINEVVFDTMVRLSPPGASFLYFERTFFSTLSLLGIWLLYFPLAFVGRLKGIPENIQDIYLDTFGRAFYFDTFHELFGMIFVMALLCIVNLLGCVFYNYAYFRKGAKSIYVMKRLHSNRELRIRCWGLPLLCMGIVALIVLIFYCLYCWIYFRFTPEELIPAQTIGFFWRYVP